MLTPTTLERFALGVLVIGYEIAHLAPSSVAWLVIVVIAAGHGTRAEDIVAFVRCA